ncbi:hypothetical protein ACFYU8_25270 [Brevibacillus sp. NPDC003359]|uniref:hypothetical protein n=1 Tax=unclassified Brevibacillus TaxID=2684853 RepID=UPI0036C5FB8C
MNIVREEAKQSITGKSILSNKARFLSLSATFITLFGFFNYMLGYSYLYGYYFGKDQNVPTSILELIISAVPFNFYTVTVMGVFVILLYSFFASLVYFIVKSSTNVKSWKTSFQKLLAVCLIIFVSQISISIIFFGEFKNNLSQIIEMGVFIWCLFFFLLVFLIWMIRSSKRPIAGISGFLYSIILLLLMAQYTDIAVDYQIAIFLFSCFPFGILLTWYKRNNFFIYYPYSALFLIMISGESLGLSVDRSIFLSLIIAVIFSMIFESVKQNLVQMYIFLKRKLQKNTDVVEIVDPKKNKANLKVTLPVLIMMCILALTTVVPYTSFITGKIMRSMIPGRAIQVIEYSNGTNNICGELVTYKDGVFYISNTKWELVVLKNIDVTVKFKQANETKCNNN